MQTAAFHTLWPGRKCGGIVNRSWRLTTGSLRVRNCRNLLTSSRVRREVLAARLDKLWHELRRYATIEKDPQTLLRLTTEIDLRKRLAETVNKRGGN
jgi:hypothetical protein